MIRSFSDHSANERTFLAWIRTGIAVIAFGFVMEKFNLFLVAVAATAAPEIAQRVARLAGPFGRYDGLALMLVGIALIIIAVWRFLRTERRIEAPELYSGSSARAELWLAAALTLLASAFCLYLVVA
ncbi:MAG: YidH family protein [Stellaceae bacterium]